MSIKRVLNAAMLSSYAHKTEEQVREALKNTNYEFVKFISDGFLQCYIAQEGKDQVLVFRESTEKDDWYANLKFFPEKSVYGIFHHTYYDKLMKVRKEIMQYITDKNFVCIGFSQGASLARLFSHIIKKREVISGYSSFFVSFEPAMESKTNNYNEYGIYTRKGNDPVTMLPFALTGWNQSGSQIYLTGRNCKAIIEPKKSLERILVAADTVMDFEDNFTKEDILRDHSIFIIKKGWENRKNQDKISELCKKKFNLK